MTEVCGFGFPRDFELLHELGRIHMGIRKVGFCYRVPQRYISVIASRIVTEESHLNHKPALKGIQNISSEPVALISSKAGKAPGICWLSC
jgi:hypothetical protein